MDEQNKEITPEETTPAKPLWQQTKERWYDKLNLTVKQLDIIIGLCIAGMIILSICIALDAMGIIGS